MADWIASKQHPLTARVYVNRLWRWHFGAGLVRTTDNFGAQGARPSHPQLLDWLAHEFMRSGWSTKAMHRLILTSSVYQQRSAPPHVQDPDNRWLAHFPVQRLTAEAIRDAWLAVSGRLDRRVGGKTVPLRNRQFVFDHTSIDHTRYDSVRRSVYLPVIRNNLYDLFRQFDFPDPTLPTGSRTTTVVAPQSLLMMNAPLVIECADTMASALLEIPLDDSAGFIASISTLLHAHRHRPKPRAFCSLSATNKPGIS